MQDYHDNLLFKKIHGYIAAGSIGNSMGELMEGYTVEERQQYWGWVDYLPEVTKHTPPRLPSVNDRAANPFDTGLGHPPIGHPHTRIPGTDIPTLFAAVGFDPTAYRCLPNLVFS